MCWKARRCWRRLPARPGSGRATAPDSPPGAMRTIFSTALTGDLLILEIGDRPEGDEGSYPQDDIQAVMGADGKWRFARKDGTPY